MHDFSGGRPMCLLFIVNVDWFVLSHRLPVALAAQRRCFDVHVALRVTTPERAAAIEASGIRLHRLTMIRGTFHPYFDLKHLVNLSHLLGSRFGFEVSSLSLDTWPQLPLRRSALAPPFRNLDDNELRVSGFDVILRAI